MCSKSLLNLLSHNDFAGTVTRITDFLCEHGSATLSEVSDRFQTSRKYAQAVLEEMDARRITRREGNVRMLRYVWILCFPLSLQLPT